MSAAVVARATTPADECWSQNGYDHALLKMYADTLTERQTFATIVRACPTHADPRVPEADQPTVVSVPLPVRRPGREASIPSRARKGGAQMQKEETFAKEETLADEQASVADDAASASVADDKD
jgi:hypothetical protein